VNEEPQKNPKRKKKFILIGITAIFIGVALAAVPGQNFAVIGNVESPKEGRGIGSVPKRSDSRGMSFFTGLPCSGGDDAMHRPIAVMLAGDERVRPLAGIGAAELVVEMPVVTWGINRLMAVYSCGGDFEVGSIRSSRDDFIPLAAGFNAIYGHWGGSYLALDQLRLGIIDNIDAISNPFNAYYRQAGLPAPDNGFTTMDTLLNAAEQLNYSVERADEEVFAHSSKPTDNQARADIIDIGYYSIYRVRWEYNDETKHYDRFRAGYAETDKNSGAQVSAGTIVTMRTRVTQPYGEYNDVVVAGSGEAVVYALGEVWKGTWEKGADLNAPLLIVDDMDNQIPFAPGAVWIQVIQPDTPVEESMYEESVYENEQEGTTEITI